MKINIFLSSKTEETKRKIIEGIVSSINSKNADLKKNGIESLELKIIGPDTNIFNKNIREQVCESIDQSSIFVSIPTEKDSEWVMFEFGYAYSKNIKILLISDSNQISGPYENINRINEIDLNTDTLKGEILKILKDSCTIRKIVINNFKNSIIRYFPLESSLRCEISRTSLNIEPYFLEDFSYSFIHEGLRFNGSFYLKQFIGNNIIPDEFTILLWFKFRENNFKNRFCDKDSRKDEPIFLYTLGNLERKENSHIGIYYGRPAIRENEKLPIGLRIFTYCKKAGINNCDSTNYKEILNDKWYFGVLSYVSGNAIKFYLYDKDSFIGEISTNYNVSINNLKNYLTIGGGFPLLKIYAGFDKNYKLRISENKKELEKSIVFPNSSLQLQNGKTKCEGEEKEITLRPYPLNFIDDFRFLGFIREFILFNRELDESERENLWKLMKNMFS